MKFTEDDILNMMLEIFRNICKFYKDGNVPRYFIPKLNLLEEYSKEIKKAFVEKLKALANLQSLPFSICQNSSKPFVDIYQGPILFHQQFLKTAIYLRKPLFYNLWYLYNEKSIKIKASVTTRINQSFCMNCMLHFYLNSWREP